MAKTRKAKEPYTQKTVSIYESDTGKYKILWAMVGAETEADFIRAMLRLTQKTLKENSKAVKDIVKGAVVNG